MGSNVHDRCASMEFAMTGATESARNPIVAIQTPVLLHTVSIAPGLPAQARAALPNAKQARHDRARR
ncbi:hypothetical protein G3N57_05795 [Paraburkholderia sp. Se-20369]|nr:hypothetical protein [Paraburkholderia sp. Se-20369]